MPYFHIVPSAGDWYSWERTTICRFIVLLEKLQNHEAIETCLEQEVKVWLGFAELELEAEQKLDELKKRLGFRALILQGKRPSGLKAAMIYIIAKERGWDIITQKQLAETYGCTEVSVQNNRKLLKQLIQNPDMKQGEKT